MTELEEKLLNARLDIMTQSIDAFEVRIDKLEDLLNSDRVKITKKNVKHIIVPKDCLVVKYKGNREIAKYRSVNDAGRLTGIQKSSIYKCLKGINKKAGGFRWVIEPKQNG